MPTPKFPGITPTDRTYTAGTWRVSRRSDLSGSMVRFLRGREATKHQLTLNFASHESADVQRILSHYRQVEGSYLAFTLSSEVQCGNDYPLDLSWRYANTPAVEQVAPREWAVAVELVAVTATLPDREADPVPDSGSGGAMVAETDPTVPIDLAGVYFRTFDSQITVANTARVLLDRLLNPVSNNQIEAASSNGFGGSRAFGGERSVAWQELEVMAAYTKVGGTLQDLGPRRLQPLRSVYEIVEHPQPYNWQPAHRDVGGLVGWDIRRTPCIIPYPTCTSQNVIERFDESAYPSGVWPPKTWLKVDSSTDLVWPLPFNLSTAGVDPWSLRYHVMGDTAYMAERASLGDTGNQIVFSTADSTTGVTRFAYTVAFFAGENLDIRSRYTGTWYNADGTERLNIELEFPDTGSEPFADLLTDWVFKFSGVDDHVHVLDFNPDAEDPLDIHRWSYSQNKTTRNLSTVFIPDGGFDYGDCIVIGNRFVPLEGEETFPHYTKGFTCQSVSANLPVWDDLGPNDRAILNREAEWLEGSALLRSDFGTNASTVGRVERAVNSLSEIEDEFPTGVVNANLVYPRRSPWYAIVNTSEGLRIEVASEASLVVVNTFSFQTRYMDGMPQLDAMVAAPNVDGVNTIDNPDPVKKVGGDSLALAFPSFDGVTMSESAGAGIIDNPVPPTKAGADPALGLTLASFANVALTEFTTVQDNNGLIVQSAADPAIELPLTLFDLLALTDPTSVVDNPGMTLRNNADPAITLAFPAFDSVALTEV